MNISSLHLDSRRIPTTRIAASGCQTANRSEEVVRSIMRSMRKLEECSGRGISPPETVFSFVATMDRILNHGERLYVAVVFATAKQERPALASLIAAGTGISQQAALTALFAYLSNTNKDTLDDLPSPSPCSAPDKFLATIRRSILTKLAPHSF